MIYRAAAALPYDSRERATAGLRGQLRMMAVAAGATPDWTTLNVEGPTEAIGLPGRIWFEWTARVVADGGEEVTDDALDAVIWGAGRPAERVAAEETAPQFRSAGRVVRIVEKVTGPVEQLVGHRLSSASLGLGRPRRAGCAGARLRGSWPPCAGGGRSSRRRCSRR